MPMETPAAERTIRSLMRQMYALSTPRLRRGFWWLCMLNIGIGFFEIGVAGGISLLGVAISAPESLTRIRMLESLRASLQFPPAIPVALQLLLLILAFVCLATLVKNLLLAYITWLQTRFAQGIAWAMGTALFRRLLEAPHTWHAAQNSGELLNIIFWRAHVSTYATGILTFLAQCVIIFFLLSGAFIANYTVSSILFISIGIIAFFIQKYCRKKIYSLSSRISTIDLYNAKVAMQGIQGHKEISIYDKKSAFLMEYTKYIPEHINKSSRRSLFPNLPLWILETAGMFLLLLVLFIQICRNAGLAETTGILTLLAAVCWRLLPAANRTLGALLDLRTYQPFVEKFFAAYDKAPAERGIAPLPERPFRHEIRLEHIRFSYPAGTRPALDDVSLTVRKGQMIGIIGPSGSGKSTLISLMAGLLSPQEGSMAVDGEPWSPLRERLRIGYVPQNLYLMDASLAANIAFSRWGTPPDEKRILQCCRPAAIDFLQELPQGLETELGEQGVRLSGGQVQRVGIARALYDRPDLLIFDEATSALDTQTENVIREAINGLRGKITIILVAHRLATVEECDILVWIENGTVKMSGPTQEVLRQYKDRQIS